MIATVVESTASVMIATVVVPTASRKTAVRLAMRRVAEDRRALHRRVPEDRSAVHRMVAPVRVVAAVVPVVAMPTAIGNPTAIAPDTRPARPVEVQPDRVVPVVVPGAVVPVVDVDHHGGALIHDNHIAAVDRSRRVAVVGVVGPRTTGQKRDQEGACAQSQKCSLHTFVIPFGSKP